MKKFFFRLSLLFVILGAVGSVLVGLFIFGAYLYISPTLPEVSALKEIKLVVPLRVFTEDGKLISEFGVEKRVPVKINNVPKLMQDAIIAAEDNEFWTHPGVDYKGLVRAVGHLIKTGKKGQGGSTITMQVARNYLLTREKTYLRKLTEIFLSLKMEKELTKETILELYVNKVFFGQRAYGVAAAAQVYYGKDLADLTLPQFAMIAGVIPSPSRWNPVTSPAKALGRRNYVLRRLYEIGKIDKKAYREALTTADDAELHFQKNEIDAQYVAEMVRNDLFNKFGKDYLKHGHQVHTTIDSGMQDAANKAVRRALLEYDMRHGYRGALGHEDISKRRDIEAWNKILENYDSKGGFLPALVVSAGNGQSAKVYEVRNGIVEIPWQGLSWAKKFITDESVGATPKTAGEIIKDGDIVHIGKMQDSDGKIYWRLAQIPKVQGALVALDPKTGAIKALVGGFNYEIGNFNRVIQAKRQPGSNFKPFIYSAALEKGYTPASIINDAPIVFEDSKLEDEWRPENYSGRVYGPTRLRKALVNSRNLVSIRLLRDIGISYAINYARRFGFTDPLPRDLSMALGTGVVTPLSVARGYATFANGGYLVEPYYTSRLLDSKGTLLEQHPEVKLCDDCAQIDENGSIKPAGPAAAMVKTKATPLDKGTGDKGTEGETPATIYAPRVLSPEIVYIMSTILRDVVNQGTGRKALSLGRNDLAGKTGTTNDQNDAWFSGFNGSLVASVWIGFDEPSPLGRAETGAGAALPMWIYFAKEALKGKPNTPLYQPETLVRVRIDEQTGLLAQPGDPDAIFEVFRKDNVPQTQEESPEGYVGGAPGGGGSQGSTTGSTGSGVTTGSTGGNDDIPLF